MQDILVSLLAKFIMTKRLTLKQSQEMNTEQLFHVNICYIIDPWLRHYNVDAQKTIVHSILDLGICK